MTRVAANDIDVRRAGLLLYALQLASTNLRSAQQSNETGLKVHPDFWNEPVPDPPQQS